MMSLPCRSIGRFIHQSVPKSCPFNHPLITFGTRYPIVNVSVYGLCECPSGKKYGLPCTRMEEKPQKKEQLLLANNVLKLSSDLLKELDKRSHDILGKSSWFWSLIYQYRVFQNSWLSGLETQPFSVSIMLF